MDLIYLPLSEIMEWALNPKIHDLPRIKRLIRQYGLRQYPAVRDGTLFVGHGRTKALAEIKKEGPQDGDLSFPPKGVDLREDGEWMIPLVPLDDLTPEAAREYALEDNNASRKGSFDQGKLKKIFQEGLVKKENTGFSKKQIRTIEKSGKKPKKMLLMSSASDVPNAIFPYEKEYGIPLLDIDMQADYVDFPFIKWGTIARTSEHHGTVHFYTDDYKFSALWKNPLQLVDTRCVTAVEPNLSTHDQMPRYEALHRIGQKRYISRFWQSQGVRVLVDLNVVRKFRQDNLLGVPAGWSAFATRAYAKQEHYLHDDYKVACEIAGGKPRLFVVYGGQKKTEALCEQNGWIWLPEQIQEKA
jgi:hypothetical protein